MNPWETPIKVVGRNECPTCVRTRRPRRERTAFFPSGAVVQWEDDVVTFHRGPSPFDPEGKLKSAPQVKAEAESWARYRLENDINTVGRDGEENAAAFRTAGMMPGAQRFAAFHDVQSDEARHQSLRLAQERPERTPELVGRYERATQESAVEGYASLTGGAESGARHAAEVFRRHGFEVSDPNDIDLGTSTEVHETLVARARTDLSTARR